MANYFTDNEDLRFYFDRAIDWEALVSTSEYGYSLEGGFKTADEVVAFYRQVAEMVGDFVAAEIAPHAAEIDRAGVSLENGEAVFPPRLAAIFDRVKELDLHGMCLPREIGGLNVPLLLYLINSEVMGRADVSVMAHHSFHAGMAMAMLLFSVLEGTTTFEDGKPQVKDTRFRSYIDEISRGAAWGCMDITEPNAGSDMAAIRSKGEQDESGNWFVTGQKIFITSGHGKYHFVIARTEEAGKGDDPFAGLAGLSMFLVPTYEDLPDGTRKRIVTLDRVEEKLGHHGSVTAALSFERAPAHLVGKRGEGFKYMLTLMNNARLGVGFESLGLMESAYRTAKEYAEGRGSMGKKIIRHEMIADYLEEMQTDIQGIRAIAMQAAFDEEMYQKLNLTSKVAPPSGELAQKKLEKDIAKHRAKARKVTPLLKYIASEKAVEMARRCIQIHGGVGYTKDYGAEKLLRDALVMPIYEGTSQIQSLMAMKDSLLGILKAPQAFAKRVAQARFKSMSAKDPLERRVAKIQSLVASAQQHLTAKIATDKLKTLGGVPFTEWPRALTALASAWDPKRDFALAMLHAERLTRLLSDEVIVEALLEQAKKFPERREILERYLDRAEPRCRFLCDEIKTTGGRLLKSLEESREPAVQAAE